MSDYLEANISTYKEEVQATAEEITSVGEYRMNLATALSNVEIADTDKQMVTQIKNAVFRGNPAESIPAYPSFTLQNLPFPAQKAGADQFYRELKARYKTAKGYTKEIGTALGFEKTSGEKVSKEELTGALKLADSGSYKYEVNFIKQGQSGMLIQDRLRGTEKWREAKTALVSPVSVDAPKPPDEDAAVQLEVRGRLIKGNTQVGKWSPIYSLTVSS